MGQQAAQTAVVELDGRSPEVMHLDNFAKKRIEETEKSKHRLVDRAQAGFAIGIAKNKFGEMACRNGSGSRDVPRLPEGCWITCQVQQGARYIRHKNEFVRCIDRSDDICRPALEGRIENRLGITEVGRGTVKIWRAQNGGPHSAFVVGGKNKVLLFFAHAPFESARIAGMRLVDRITFRPAIGVDRTHQKEMPDSGRGSSFEGDAGQLRVQLKMVVRHARQVEDHLGVCGSGLDGGRIAEIGGEDLRLGLKGFERLPETFLATAHYPEAGVPRGHFGSERSANGSGRSKDRKAHLVPTVAQEGGRGFTYCFAIQPELDCGWKDWARMKAFKVWIKRLKGLASRRDQHGDFAAEMESHAAMHIADNIRSGMTEAEARRQASLKLGRVTAAEEAYREQKSIPVLENLLLDLRYAWFQLRKAPGFSIAAVLTLAIAIGAVTSVFSGVYSLLIRPLPFPDSASLLWISSYWPKARLDAMISPDFMAARQRLHSFESLGGFTFGTSNLSGAEGALRVARADVTANFLATLKIAPSFGRDFAPSEDQPGRAESCVVEQSSVAAAVRRRSQDGRPHPPCGRRGLDRHWGAAGWLSIS